MQFSVVSSINSATEIIESSVIYRMSAKNFPLSWKIIGKKQEKKEIYYIKLGRMRMGVGECDKKTEW